MLGNGMYSNNILTFAENPTGTEEN